MTPTDADAAPGTDAADAADAAAPPGPADDARPSPLKPRLIDAKAELGTLSPFDADGAEVALSFSGVQAEHRAVRQRCGLIDLHPLGVARFVGDDRMDFLHNMLPADVRGRGGEVLDANFLDAHGKVQAAFRLAMLDDSSLALLEGPVEPLRDALSKYLLISGTTLDAEDRAGLAVQGPDAADILEAAGLAVPDPGRAVEEGDDAGGPDATTVLGVDVTGSGGWWVVAPPDRLAELWTALRDAGATPVGRRAAEALRIEAAVPRWRTEITDEVLPLEIGLRHTVDFEKGCYLGQEAVAKMENLGRPRYHLETLLLEGPVPGRGAAVTTVDEDALVGEVTSAADSPGAGGVVALARMKRDKGTPGTAVRAGKAEGEVVDSPLFDADATS